MDHNKAILILNKIPEQFTIQTIQDIGMLSINYVKEFVPLYRKVEINQDGFNISYTGRGYTPKRVKHLNITNKSLEACVTEMGMLLNSLNILISEEEWKLAKEQELNDM